MARKKEKQRSPGKPPRPVRKPKMPGDPPSRQEVVKELLANRPALVGFLLSVLQLLGHMTWILLVWYLSVMGKATKLNSDSLLSWVIVGILGISLILTFVSLFICLFYGLRREPRVLAVAGFALSFFVGILASAVVFMTGLRAMSGS